MRLGPVLEWIEAAIPQQNPALLSSLSSLSGRIDLIVTGPGSRTISVGTGDPVTTIESDGPSLVRWITQRARWEDLTVNAEGAAEVLGIIPLLKVY
jgi:hypothetical protein